MGSPSSRRPNGEPRRASLNRRNFLPRVTRGRPDSALAAYERGLDAADPFRFGWESGRQPLVVKRAGELHEAAGNRERAIERCNQFVELWANADPELQPLVRDVRERIARLVGEGGKAGSPR